MRPLRQLPGLKANGSNPAGLLTDPVRERLGLAGDLSFLHNLPVLVPYADSSLLQRHILSDEQPRPEILLQGPIGVGVPRFRGRLPAREL